MLEKFTSAVLIGSLISFFSPPPAFGQGIRGERVDYESIKTDKEEPLELFEKIAQEQIELRGLLNLVERLEKIDHQSAALLGDMVRERVEKLKKLSPEEQSIFLESSYYDSREIIDEHILDYEQGRTTEKQLKQNIGTVLSEHAATVIASTLSVLLVVGPAFAASHKITEWYVKLAIYTRNALVNAGVLGVGLAPYWAPITGWYFLQTRVIDPALKRAAKERVKTAQELSVIKRKLAQKRDEVKMAVLREVNERCKSQPILCGPGGADAFLKDPRIKEADDEYKKKIRILEKYAKSKRIKDYEF